MIYVNIIHHKKNHPKIQPTILIFEYMYHFSKVCDKYYFGTCIPHMFKIFNVCWICF